MTTVDALTHASRQKARRKLLREGAVLFGLTAVAVVVVYFLYGRSTTESPWQVAGTKVQDVSRSEGIQTEVAVAVDPADGQVLFGAANESLEPQIRVFSSS